MNFPSHPVDACFIDAVSACGDTLRPAPCACLTLHRWWIAKAQQQEQTMSASKQGDVMTRLQAVRLARLASLSSYKKRPYRSIVQQFITTQSHFLKCSTSSGRVRNNILPLIANAPEGRLITNNPLWKILNCAIVWQLKCFLIRFLARSVYCIFIIYVQWMCRIYSLIDITKMI